MESQKMPQYNTLFATDQDCIAYLFQKRWSDGFHCPSCDRHQKEIAPAHTVVCRYCRKQNSITAGTLMHGSKKNHSEWIQVAAQFCFSKDGMSARSLQNSHRNLPDCVELAKKQRKAAAIAESSPLKGPVQLTLSTAEKKTSSHQNTSQIACIIEIAEGGGRQGRIRLATLQDNTPDQLPAFITHVVTKGSIIIIVTDSLPSLISINGDFQLQRTDTDNAHAIELISERQGWMRNIYRGATDPKYLQDYLDEFCFRHNTASWNNSLAILDHLLTGIMGDNANQPLSIPPTPAEDK